MSDSFTGMVAFGYLVVSIYFIKPLLYDLSVAVSERHLRFRGGCASFRQSLIAANPDNVQLD